MSKVQGESAVSSTQEKVKLTFENLEFTVNIKAGGDE